MSASTVRPRRLVVVAGTGTEVGKTWVAVRVIERLVADGWVVAPRKPAQSGNPGETTDADHLAAAAGCAAELVCPPHRSYTVPMAPPMAAEATGVQPPTIAELRDEIEGSWGGIAPDLGLVELAGGVASPIALEYADSNDGTSSDDGAALTRALRPDLVVLVADAGLGTINSVRMSVGALAGSGPAGSGLAGSGPVVVLLNRFDAAVELHRRNLEWLAERDGFRVLTEPGDLAAAVIGETTPFCGSCGRSSAECDGSCRRPLDPDRHCERCGRRLVVSISPAGHQSRCRVHGSISS